jgi:hypothetical protein
MASAGNVEERLVRAVASYAKDPLGFARFAYQWGDGDLKGSSGPRTWQADILDVIGKHLQNPATRFQPLKVAVSSGKGIGKTALISTICHWGMSTCVDTKVVVTANTHDQLRTKTWPEMTKWFRQGINAHWFDCTATAIASVNDKHRLTWRADAIAWNESHTESFQGLHNQNRRIIAIFDEASGIPDSIWNVTEDTLTDANTEIIWVAFSNPTRNTGRFRECFGRMRHRWVTRQIDSRKVEGTNKDEINRLVEDWGEDSDRVRIGVKGEFPRVGMMQFISGDVADAAARRPAVSTLYDPCVMGVDVARFGEDESVIVIRRGRDARSIPWERFRGVDTMTLAARVAELQGTHRCDAIFVDGGGVGGGVIDRLRMLGHPVIEVQFGGKADRGKAGGEQATVYANKRSEIWGTMRDWLKGGAIPDDQEILMDLVGVQYGYAVREGRDAIMLEKKADMKKRGLASPDLADALALTLAYDVMPRDHRNEIEKRGSQHTFDYDPLGRGHIEKEFRKR